MQIGRFSLPQLQGLGRIYGRQDKTARILVPLKSVAAHQQTKQPCQLMLEIEELVLSLPLELDLPTPQ